MSCKPIIFLLLGYLLSSCNWSSNVEEGDRNTYTWKGKLVEDCSETPAANVDISLEVTYTGVPDDDYEVIASTTTDADGNFSLTYKRIRKANASDVSLLLDNGQLSGGTLLVGPVNENVDRNVAIEDCSLLFVSVRNLSGQDSLYLSVGEVFDTPYRQVIALPEYDASLKVPVLALPLAGADFQEQVWAQAFLAPSWNNQAFDRHYGYGTSYAEIKRSLLSNLLDSIPDNYNVVKYNSRGYPKVDTISIEL